MFSTTGTGFSSETLCAKFIEQSLVQESVIPVYKDDSECATGIGFATVFPHRVIFGRLLSAYSVFTSELRSILPAIACMFRLPESEFVIYSDSQRVLCSIGNPFCHHPLIRGTHRWLRSLRDRGKTAHFCSQSPLI